mgnify:CR=1 FL=1
MIEESYISGKVRNMALFMIRYRQFSRIFDVMQACGLPRNLIGLVMPYNIRRYSCKNIF